MNPNCKAILFDTGGTVLDWHSSIADELAAFPPWRDRALDRHAFVNEWRRRTMRGIVGQLKPAFHMDDVHRNTLHETIAHYGLPPLRDTEHQALCGAWHRLRAWPDFPPALARLRERLPVVSFTMLPLALIVAVSRRNALTWDAVVSCQMMGVYKPHAQAYLTAAAWLGHAPSELLMVACHNFDLNAAQDAGMRTAFVRRPDEWGPSGPPDPEPNRAYDHVVRDFGELVDQIFSAG